MSFATRCPSGKGQRLARSVGALCHEQVFDALLPEIPSPPMRPTKGRRSKEAAQYTGGNPFVTTIYHLIKNEYSNEVEKTFAGPTLNEKRGETPPIRKFPER